MKTAHIVFIVLTFVGLLIGYLSRNGFGLDRNTFLDTDPREMRKSQILQFIGIFCVYEFIVGLAFLGLGLF